MCSRILNYPRTVSDTETDWELRKAFTMWSEASALTFQYVDASQPADIEISFVAGYHNDGAPFDGEGRAYKLQHLTSVSSTSYRTVWS